MNKPVHTKPDPKTPPELRKLARALVMLAAEQTQTRPPRKPRKAS